MIITILNTSIPNSIDVLPKVSRSDRIFLVFFCVHYNRHFYKHSISQYFELLWVKNKSKETRRHFRNVYR